MSAWKPRVFGQSTFSSRSSDFLHEWRPPQQISPSAASFSPNPSATLHASRNVFTMFFVAP